MNGEVTLCYFTIIIWHGFGILSIAGKFEAAYYEKICKS